MNPLLNSATPADAFSAWSILAMLFVGLILLGLGYAATRPDGTFAASLWRLLTRPAAIVIRIIGRPLAWIGGRIPGASAAFDGLIGTITADRLRDAFDRRFGGHADDLTAGRLEAYAARRWPAEAHPQLWRRVPEDLRRPLIVDGRLPDGSHPADVLAPSFVSDELVAAGARSGVVAATLLLAIALLFTAWNAAGIAAAGAAPSPTTALDTPSSGQIAHLDENLWTADDRKAYAAEAVDYRDALLAQRLRDAQSSPLWLLLPAAGCLRRWPRFFRGLVRLDRCRSVCPRRFFRCPDRRFDRSLEVARRSQGNRE